jgi:hypothetical protein
MHEEPRGNALRARGILAVHASRAQGKFAPSPPRKRRRVQKTMLRRVRVTAYRLGSPQKIIYGIESGLLLAEHLPK